MCDARRLPLLPRDDGDRRIGDHLGLEGWRIHHVDVDLQVEVLGHEIAEWPAIPILHPAVGADEAKMPTLLKEGERALEERDVEVSAIIDRRVARSVLRHQRVRNELLAHIGRVADDEVEPAGQLDEQEITMDQPGVGELPRWSSGDAVAGQPVDHRLARAGEGGGVELDGPDAVRECGERIRVALCGASPSRQQPVDGRQEEVPISEGGLQVPHPVQRLVGGVSGQVEDEVHHLAPREDRTTGLDASTRQHGVQQGRVSRASAEPHRP